MLKEENIMDIPPKQRMERQETVARDHSEQYRAALHRAVMLAVPHAFSPSEYGTFSETSNENGSADGSPITWKKHSRKGASSSWNELIEGLFEKDEPGKMVFNPSTSNES